MINIVLFGAPGAGKGTQAGKLTQKYGLNHISTGDVIRAEIREKTPLGLMVEEGIARGELAPDKVVIEIIDHYMHPTHEAGVGHRTVSGSGSMVESGSGSVSGHGAGHGAEGNIFDGFPRTIPQAEAFDAILARHGMRVDAMLELVVPEEVLVQRILLRGESSGRADDVDEAVIRNRIEVYNAQTAVVAEYYRAQGKYVAIDGSVGMDAVFEELCGEVDKLME